MMLQRTNRVVALLLIAITLPSIILSQSDRRLIQRRRDAINNWIRRIRSSKRGYSLSPSWNGKSPYHVPSVANLPLQTEPDNTIRTNLPVRRFKRKRIQDSIIAPKFPPNFDELNFDGFDEALELTDFEGNPLKTEDFHPDVDEESPVTHKDPYVSFDDSGFLGDFKTDYPFPTAPAPTTEKPTESPSPTKYPYRNQQEIVLNEEVNNVPRRPVFHGGASTNKNEFKPSFPYKPYQDSYPYPSYPNYDSPRSTPPPRNHYRFTPNINYRPPIGQFEHFGSNGGGFRGISQSSSPSSGGGDSFFDTFDAFGPTGERRVFNAYRKKPHRKNASRRRFKPKRLIEDYDSYDSNRVPILTPKVEPFYPTISTTISTTTTTTTATISTSTTAPTTTMTSYRRESTTTRPIPTPGPFDFPPAPPQRSPSRPRHPTHPPIITHPPNHGRRTKDYSYPHGSFSDFDSFDTRFESMRIRNKRNSEYYEYEDEDYEDETRHAERRFGRIGSDFWSDANIEYDYFDNKPQIYNDEEEEETESEDLNYRFQGENSYRKQHSVYPQSNFGFSKGYSYTKNSNINSNTNNNGYNGGYKTYFSQNDLPSSTDKAILGSGNFDVLTGGTFDDLTTRRSYSTSSGSSYTRNYSNNSPYSHRSNRRKNNNQYDLDPAIRFANFKDFATIKKRRPY